MTPDLILVLNAGSSSIKTALFDADLQEVLRLEATGIGADQHSGGQIAFGPGTQRQASLPDHGAALELVLETLTAQGLSLDRLRAVGHRVVQGGRDLTRTQSVTPAVRDAIAAAVPLAPLHNPHHLSAIDALTRMVPDLPQIASFDTAFHATNSDLARAYALPDRAETQGLMRYGFHGNSYAAITGGWQDQTGTPLPDRLLAFHLGNGSSICAIRQGKSVATTMGFSPLSGLTMGTRSGDIDAAAVLYLARQLGLDGAEQLLNSQSGLLGLSGLSADMRSLLASTDPRAQFAVDHYCYWAARHAGSLITAMQGLDAIVFTGGIGENAAPIRDKITDHLSWLGPVPSRVVVAEEERHIARETAAFLEDNTVL